MFLEFRKRSGITQKAFPLGHWSFFGPVEENEWYGTHNYKPERKWNTTADVRVDSFKESGHPILRGASALTRGVLQRNGGRCTIHFNAESSNAEFSKAVANWCGDSAQLILGRTHMIMEKSVANGKLPIISKVGAAESGFFSTDTKGECSSSG